MQVSLAATNLVKLHSTVVNKSQDGFKLIDMMSMFNEPFATRLGPRLFLTHHNNSTLYSQFHAIVTIFANLPFTHNSMDYHPHF